MRRGDPVSDLAALSQVRQIVMDTYQSEIEHAIQNELSAEDRATLERASDLYRKKAKGCDLDEWIEIGLAHNVHVRLALRLANTNTRSGQVYSRYLSQIMKHHGIDPSDKTLKGILTALAWVCDDANPERLEALNKKRSTMTPGKLAHLNSPHTARTLIRNILNEQSGYEPAPKKPSLLEKNKALSDENTLLKERIVHAESGSLFDRSDKWQDVVGTIVRSSFTHAKLKQVEDGLKAWRKEHPEQKSKPPTLKIASK